MSAHIPPFRIHMWHTIMNNIKHPVASTFLTNDVLSWRRQCASFAMCLHRLTSTCCCCCCWTLYVTWLIHIHTHKHRRGGVRDVNMPVILGSYTQNAYSWHRVFVCRSHNFFYSITAAVATFFLLCPLNYLFACCQCVEHKRAHVATNVCCSTQRWPIPLNSMKIEMRSEWHRDDKKLYSSWHIIWWNNIHSSVLSQVPLIWHTCVMGTYDLLTQTEWEL